MEFQDKVLTCIDCGAEFVFTAGEQLFFHDKQFKNEPKRCKSCKSKRVAVLPPLPRATDTTSRASRPVPLVPSAARRPLSPFARRRAAPSSAANALRRGRPSLPPDRLSDFSGG